MRYTAVVSIAAFAAQIYAHGVITSIQGANGVTMPGLSVQDGTPRDCASPACGSEADTSIIRKNGPPLGKTKGAGSVDAASAIQTFMGGAGTTGATNGANSPASPAITTANKSRRGINLRSLLDSLTSEGASSGTDATGSKTPKGTTENSVSKLAGTGATSGLPTCADDGTVAITFHQVNQDGAGPLTAAVDPASGGTDSSAFKTAAVTQNVPGLGISGLSGATTTDFPVKIQMPAGMTCQGTVGGASNVCIAKLQNSAAAGPFGGSVAFTQSPAAKKRALKYQALSKRHFARGTLEDIE